MLCFMCSPHSVTKTKKFRASIILINISAESQSVIEKLTIANDPNQFKMFLTVYHLVQYVKLVFIFVSCAWTFDRFDQKKGMFVNRNSSKKFAL